MQDDPTRALNDLVDLVYESLLDPAAAHALVRGVCGALGADAAQFLSVAPINRQGFWVGHGIDPASVTAYERYYAAISPWRSRYPALQRGELAVIRGERLVDDRALIGGEFYRDFLRPNGQRWMAAALLRPHGPSASCYGLYLYRRPERETFGADAEHVLGTLGTHLLRAERVGATAAMWQTEQNDPLVGAFLVTAQGQLLECNEVAQRMLAEGVVRLSGGGSIGLRTQHAGQWLYCLLSQGVGHLERAHCMIERHAGLASLELRLAPMHLIARSPLTRAAAFVLTARRVEPECAANGLERVARERHHWTRTEFEVVNRLVSGERVDQIACTRGNSVETVRSHIKSAKRKAGVSRQMDLVRLMHQLERAGGGD